MDKDIFDDFEFKPITEGLGFHKKSISLQDQVKTSGVVRDEIAKTVPPAPEPLFGGTSNGFRDEEYLDFKRALSGETQVEDLTEPLPRVIEREAPIPKSINIDDLFPDNQQRQQFRDESEEKTPEQPAPSFSHFSSYKRRPRKNAFWSISAAILDGVVILATSLLFIVALLSITGVDFLENLTHVQADPMVRVSLGVLFLSVLFIYMILTRSFFACTLGEWTFDLRLGKRGQLAQTSYPLRVFLRTFLVSSTGFLFLSTLTLLTGKDIAGKMSGIELTHADA